MLVKTQKCLERVDNREVINLVDVSETREITAFQ